MVGVLWWTLAMSVPVGDPGQPIHCLVDDPSAIPPILDERVAFGPIVGLDETPAGASDDFGLQLGRDVVGAVTDAGLQPDPRREIPADATDCDAWPLPTSCADRIVDVWSSAPQQTRFFVMGAVTSTPTGPKVELRIHDLHDADPRRPMATLRTTYRDGDLITPIVFPEAVARAIEQRLHPPPPPTDEELEILAHLDDPSPSESEPDYDPGTITCWFDEPPPYDDRYWLDPHVHPRDAFVEFCREGPRHGPDDLRPVCKRGPVLGYVRPRTWVMASLFGASTIGTAVAFGLHGAGWRTAGWQLGDRRLGAPLTTWGTVAAVSATSMLMGAIVTAIVDRRRAVAYIRREKQLRYTGP